MGMTTTKIHLDDTVRIISRRHGDDGGKTGRACSLDEFTVWVEYAAGDIRSYLRRDVELIEAHTDAPEHYGTSEDGCTECGHVGTGQVPGCSCVGCDI